MTKDLCSERSRIQFQHKHCSADYVPYLLPETIRLKLNSSSASSQPGKNAKLEGAGMTGNSIESKSIATGDLAEVICNDRLSSIYRSLTQPSVVSGMGLIEVPRARS